MHVSIYDTCPSDIVSEVQWSTVVIRSFKDRRTEAVFRGEAPKGLGSDLVKIGYRKLRMIDFAVQLEDLRSPPRNCLEPLKRDRSGQHSIRINDQFRICFDGHQRGLRTSRSRITTIADEVSPRQFERNTMLDGKLPPLHPGEILREEFIVPHGLTAGAVARAIGVPRTRIERIVAEQIGISADSALRLGRYLGTSAQFWMNAQANFDLETAQTLIGEATNRIEPHRPRAA